MLRLRSSLASALRRVLPIRIQREASWNILASRLSALNARLQFIERCVVGQNVDLVNFGDVRLFMFTDDNLYILAVPNAFPGAQQLAEHLSALEHRPDRHTMIADSV